jgi:hypothetical protein
MLAALSIGWLAAGPSGFLFGSDRFTAAIQELPLATAPNHPPSGRVSEEGRRRGEGTQHESDGMQRWMELKDKALTARSSRPSQGLGEIQGIPWIRGPYPYAVIPPMPVGWPEKTRRIAGWTCFSLR